MKKIVKKTVLNMISMAMAISLIACGYNTNEKDTNNTNITNITSEKSNSNSENDKNNNSVDIREENELNRVKVCKQCNAGVKRSKEAAYYYIPMHPFNDIPSMNVVRNNTDEEKSRYYITQTSYTDVMNLQRTIYIVEPHYSIERNTPPETLEDTAKALSESALKELDNFVKASDLQLVYGEKSTINGYDTMKFTGTFKNTLDTGIYEGYLTGYCFIYKDVPYGIVSVINNGWKYPDANDDAKKEANDLVDGCIQTVQVLDSYTGMAKEADKSDGVFYNVKSLVDKAK